jgi:hypothetical protein
VKEHEIAGRDVVQLDLLPDFVLVVHFTRQRDAEPSEHILREPAAVEARGVAAAIAVGRAAERERRLDQRALIGCRRGL